MKVLGEKIREARIKKRISYKTLHKRTKISIDTIQAIEEGNVKHLPLTYFIAFVRTLSREVGLNPDALLQEYNVRQRRLLEEKIQIENHERIYQKVGGIWKKWNRWILLGMIGLGFVVLIGFYISYGRKFFIEPNIAELTEQAGDSTMPVLVSPDSIGTDRFILHAISLNNTWIEVRVDSGKFETVFMQRGEKTEWQVKKSIFLGLEDS
ncbi:helix-turn-helix domain-containing protein, partial [bacterium]|nr:helix-turn-helix domain-containing protein [bacterium]